MKTELFDYFLPGELIALRPPEKRDGGSMLVLSLKTGALEHCSVGDLPERLPGRALLVANDTRVIKARLRGKRPTGGAVEVLLVRETGRGEKTCCWTALAQANKPIKTGVAIEFGDLKATVIEKRPGGEIELEFDLPAESFAQYVECRGEVPLPPYIRRPVEPGDKERYQTLFAKFDGSVAAPTAGLHFTKELMEKLAKAGVEMAFVTLHVGPGTFKPIKTDDTERHEMDKERYAISDEAASAINSAKAQGRPVIAVGTTVARALEGAFAEHGLLAPCSGETGLFIAPGFSFNVIDGLFTNFHLPKSTLLCLVSALAGREKVLAAYQTAVNMRYRFYSYGDAMLIVPKSK